MGKKMCCSCLAGKVLVAIFSMIVLGLSCTAQAASCTSMPSMPYLQAANNIAVPFGLADGSTVPGTVRMFTFSGLCQNPDGNKSIYAGAPIVSCYYGSGTEVLPGVYSTGVAGLGIRLRNSSGQPMQNAAGIQCDTRNALLGTLNSDLSYSVTVSIEFVKIGQITGGALSETQTRFGFGVYQSAVGLGGSSNYIGFVGDVSVRSITCTTVSPLTIDLGVVQASTLVGVGTVGKPVPFTIKLNCDSPAVVGVTFDGVGVPVSSAAQGVVGVQSGVDAAQGIGVQLVSQGANTPVPLQVRNALGSIQANTTQNYDYALRYYSLAARPAPGTVNGAMVYTFDYQ
ncbi:fimbrial protein [Pseudomonas sp. NY15435]|uniref:fimbrial protein n=1 Tax=Pseudomonas sp. NY15435 TaxID=3400358 RepID=UPI003A855EB7